MIRIKRILVPVDLSEFANHALAYARELASAYDAEVHLLHVVEPQWMLSAGGTAAPEYDAAGLDRFVADGEAYLERLEGGLEGIGTRTEVAVGVPHVQIVEYARREEIDIIVQATHGRTGIKHVRIGSVAERVVQMAPCPVLTVKNPEHEFVLP